MSKQALNDSISKLVDDLQKLENNIKHIHVHHAIARANLRSYLNTHLILQTIAGICCVICLIVVLFG